MDDPARLECEYCGSLKRRPKTLRDRLLDVERMTLKSVQASERSAHMRDEILKKVGDTNREMEIMREALVSALKLHRETRILAAKHALLCSKMRLEWLMQNPDVSRVDVMSVYQAMARDIAEGLAGMDANQPYWDG